VAPLDPTGTFVDSNVILDIATNDPQWSDWSANALVTAARTGPLVINAVVFAEVSVGYDRIEDADRALPADLYLRAPVPDEAAFLAAKAFVAYRRRAGRRDHPLPDFFIGAHAAVADLTLLTRDPRRYRAAYPQLRLIHP
jgi:predicted nucleic acid-binding protein